MLLASRRDAAAVAAATTAAAAACSVPVAGVCVDAAEDGGFFAACEAAARVRAARLFERSVADGVLLACSEAAGAAVARLADGPLALEARPPLVADVVAFAFAGALRCDFVACPAPELFVALPPRAREAAVSGAGAGAAAAGAGAAAATGALATCPGAESRPFPGLSAGGAANAGWTTSAAAAVAHTSISAIARRGDLAVMTSRDPVERA